MSFIAGYLLGLEDGGSGVIKSITITQNGDYYAPIGVDGYNPVFVRVPDRYDEGYQKGYKDGEKIYKDLYDHDNGILPSATDEQGNVIDNAIVIDNYDDLNKYICNTDFSSDGDSVTVTGFDGDVTFKLTRIRQLDYWEKWENKISLTLTNKITGEKFEYGGTYTVMGDNVKPNVTGIHFFDDYSSISIGIEYTRDDGTTITDTVRGNVSSVGGTKFIGTGTNEWIYS